MTDNMNVVQLTEYQKRITTQAEFLYLKNEEKLYEHQEFVRRYFSPYTKHNKLILFHTLGSGKSRIYISITVDHYIKKGIKGIIITNGDSGTEYFKGQIKEYGNITNMNLKHIFSFNHYISLSNKLKIMPDFQVTKEFDNTIILLDECHTVKNTDINNEKNVYHEIQRLVNLCKNSKVIIATGTPITDNKNEIYKILGVIYGKEILAKDYPLYSKPFKALFYNIVSYNKTLVSIPRIEYMYNNEINGCKIYETEMCDYQLDLYLENAKHEKIEDIYRSLTYISMFCFPDGSYGQLITGNVFKIDKINQSFALYGESSIKPHAITRYRVKPSYLQYLEDNVLLRKCSSKYHKLMELIQKHKGKIFIFLEDVRGSGALLLCSILESRGYIQYYGEHINQSSTTKKKRYTLCVGDKSITSHLPYKINGFNDPINKHGEYIQIIVGSRVIGECITLLDVNYFHFITPHWNYSTFHQALGRVIRNNSHQNLEESKRFLQVFLHVAIVPKSLTAKVIDSVDVKKIKISCKKSKDIEEMCNLLKELCIEKGLFLIHKKNLSDKVDVKNYLKNYFVNNKDEFISKVLEDYDFDVDKITLFEDVVSFFECNGSILMSILYHIIVENIMIKQRYMRIYQNKIYFTDDIYCPYYSPPIKEVALSSLIDNTNNNIIIKEETTEDINDSIKIILKDCHKDLNSYLNSKDVTIHLKIKLFEYLVLEGMFGVIDNTYYYKYMYHKDEDKIYHIMNHRIVYKYYSTTKMPQANSETRVFDGKKWMYLKDVKKEKEILDMVYNNMVEAKEMFITQQDSSFIISYFGILAFADNEMKVFFRDDMINIRESSSSSITIDTRKIPRGIKMTSIKEEKIYDMYVELFSSEDIVVKRPEKRQKKKVIKKICDEIFKRRLYLVF